MDVARLRRNRATVHPYVTKPSGYMGLVVRDAVVAAPQDAWWIAFPFQATSRGSHAG
jgi:hypothetical protein